MISGRYFSLYRFKIRQSNVAQIVTSGTLQQSSRIRDVESLWRKHHYGSEVFKQYRLRESNVSRTYKENKAFREHVEGERNRKLYLKWRNLLKDFHVIHLSIRAESLSQDVLTKTVPLLKLDKAYSASLQESDGRHSVCVQDAGKVGLS